MGRKRKKKVRLRDNPGRIRRAFVPMTVKAFLKVGVTLTFIYRLFLGVPWMTAMKIGAVWGGISAGIMIIWLTYLLNSSRQKQK